MLLSCVLRCRQPLSVIVSADPMCLEAALAPRPPPTAPLLLDAPAAIHSEILPSAPAAVTTIATADVDALLSQVTRVSQASLLNNPPATPTPAIAVRRSGRLGEKNKSCKIPIAKRAEAKLLESFGEAASYAKDLDPDAVAVNKMSALFSAVLLCLVLFLFL